MQYVFVLDQNKKPLDPCHPARVRRVLNSGQAAVFRKNPFSILMENKVQEDSTGHEHRLKIDPGSKTTGFAPVRECTKKVLWAGEIQHRGQAVSDALLSRRQLPRGRRGRKWRYRPARFDKTSLMFECDNLISRKCRYRPVRFDKTSLMFECDNLISRKCRYRPVRFDKTPLMFECDNLISRKCRYRPARFDKTSLIVLLRNICLVRANNCHQAT